ncbi:MAG: FHA domain-containing protein [Rhodanobacteraceae bacterium]
MRVGCAQDDDVVLGGTGVAPHHASIVADARGLVLKVAPACQRVYVNARAVRERALLHYGDTLTFGGSKLLVTTDAPPPGAADAATTDVGGVTEPVAVRVVSGKASGQALAVQPELHLGADTRCFGELPFACRIAQTADGLVFESDSATPSVNGWHCRRAKLAPNDQITLGEHRLIIEAPGLQYAAYVASLPPPEPAAVNEPNTAEDSQHTGIWWLIAAAAVLAVIIALFLYFHG